MIVFAEEALGDLERIFEFNALRDPASAPEHLGKIRSAVMILEEHPEIGRICEPGSALRELVISHGKSGYVALYEHSAVEHLIRVVAVRHQREAGYRGR
ncbi:MAG TPA: type II toxin-antitoxin system RelE/ParE family toxin [Burkholderiales bacterium]